MLESLEDHELSGKLADIHGWDECMLFLPFFHVFNLLMKGVETRAHSVNASGELEGWLSLQSTQVFKMPDCLGLPVQTSSLHVLSYEDINLLQACTGLVLFPEPADEPMPAANIAQSVLACFCRLDVPDRQRAQSVSASHRGDEA